VTDGDGGTGPVDDLRRAVAVRAGADLVVEATAHGFTVGHRRPVVAPGPAGSRSATDVAAVVRCDPGRMTYTLEDRVRRGTASRGGGAGSTGAFRGRAAGAAAVSVYGRRADGSWGRLSRTRQAPSRLHRAVRDAATDLGWREKDPVSVVVAKVAAGVALGGGLLGGVVVAVLALAGALPG